MLETGICLMLPNNRKTVNSLSGRGVPTAVDCLVLF
jgi:hypothetical protein